MANDTRTKETPVEESQEEAMSTSEQTPSESGEAVAQVEEAAPEKTEELELPDDAKDRTTEQFDKLKEQLRDERVRREEAEAVTTSQYYNQPVTGVQKPIYDAATGIVDVEELEALRGRTTKAEKAAVQSDRKLEKYIARQQENEAFSAYPELSSKSKDYNKNFAVMSRDLMTGSIMNPKDYGGELSLVEAATMIRGMSAKDIKAAEKAGAAKAVEELTPKEQASLEATGRSDRRNEVEVDYGTLRTASRSSDRKTSQEAVVARLRALQASQG